MALLTAVGAGAAFAAPSGEGGRDVERGDDGGELAYQETIDLAFEDIQAYWEETLPEISGIEYRVIPDDHFIAYTSETDPDTPLLDCGAGEFEYEPNAFYCPLGAETGDDFIAYDDETLFPTLFEDFGPFAVVQVLAHEWGHAVQGQGVVGGALPEGFLLGDAPSVQVELQADCFAGAYIGWVDASQDDAFRLNAGDLETGLAGMLFVADPIGTAATDPGAHGSGFDRANAFSEGFEQGAARCAEYSDLNSLPPVTEIPFTTEADLAAEGNLPLDEAIELGVEDLDLYWQAVFEVNGLEYDGIQEGVEGFDSGRRRTLRECEGLDLDPRRPRDYEGAVFYCPGEEFVAYDEDLLDEAHGTIGDFAALLLIANAWAAGMQEDLGLEGEPLQVDCFAGSYSGSIPIELDGDGVGDFAANGGPVVRDFDLDNATIQLSPGDLDEVVMSFLTYSEPATGEDPDELTAYTRLQSFRQGFFAGESECAALTG